MKVLTDGSVNIDVQVRKMVWRSVRIMRRFTLSGLLMTMPCGVDGQHVQKYFHGLLQNGYLGKLSAEEDSADEFQSYALLRDSGPGAPLLR